MRFVVHSITGYPLNVGTGKAVESTSYCVLDHEYNYHEVASFYSRRGSHDKVLQRLANECAARLNAEYGSDE